MSEVVENLDDVKLDHPNTRSTFLGPRRPLLYYLWWTRPSAHVQDKSGSQYQGNEVVLIPEIMTTIFVNISQSRLP